MTVKQVILAGLTALAIALFGWSLLSSWQQPQIQSRLELYQTDLLLTAAEWQAPPTDAEAVSLQSALKTFLGANPLQSALEQYQDIRQQTQTHLEQTQTEIQSLVTAEAQPNSTPLKIARNAGEPEQQRLQAVVNQLVAFLDDLDVRLGLLQTQQQQVGIALKNWQQVRETADPVSSAQIAEVLIGLWSTPPNATAGCRATNSSPFAGVVSLPSPS
ncbi:hypothetical protein [Neosynechococcus sphagnicola]|uniref:hypothetical protein n=1 Tax=Neosynechococcus sphagnicola TaxID=1501145 RepID=UPI0019554886|nr:hypothetical protein [Neosynechococcus sphagnicola]